MNNLEKILLLEIVNKQFGKLHGDNPEYYSTYNNLDEPEKNRFHNLSGKIHEYWNYINLPKNIPFEMKRVNSINEYDEEIEQVDKQVLQICNDFDLTLKNERDEKTGNLLKKFLGDKYDELFGE